TFCKEPTGLTSLALFVGGLLIPNQPFEQNEAGSKPHFPPLLTWMHPTRGKLNNVSGGGQRPPLTVANSRKSDLASSPSSHTSIPRCGGKSLASGVDFPNWQSHITKIAGEHACIGSLRALENQIFIVLACVAEFAQHMVSQAAGGLDHAYTDH